MVIKVEFPSGPGLSLLFGYREENLRRLESALGVRLVARGNEVSVKGAQAAAEAAARILRQLRDSGDLASPEAVKSMVVNLTRRDDSLPFRQAAPADLVIRLPRLQIVPRGPRQTAYVRALRSSDVVFSVGPAGTGKTYLAVGCALAAFMAQKVERIILVRPVVEAGERLGFLPGGIEDKVNPYMRPLYDALKDMLDLASLRRLIEQEIIEIAPLAYMRGRTLNRAFIILDEAQNTTVDQMRMFLTRLGVGSRAVMTGDITQIDLPSATMSGLVHAVTILKDVPGIEIIRFLPDDVVRHEMVQKILNVYAKERAESGKAGSGAPRRAGKGPAAGK